jgi:hypothetical protein
MDPKYFSRDTQDLLKLLYEFKVRYVIVGGEAVIYYGYPRLTGDLDIFYEAETRNAKKLFNALMQFWGGKIPDIKSFKEFLKKGIIIQFGAPPNRIDLINTLTGISFNEAWKDKVREKLVIEGKTYMVYFIGLDALIKNKRALSRPKDMDDLIYLEKKKRDHT